MIGACKSSSGDGAWINGGFFVLDPGVLGYIKDDSTVWEAEPLQRLAVDGQLAAFQHHGFWQAMDTLREKNQLEQLWSSGKAPPNTPDATIAGAKRQPSSLVQTATSIGASVT